MHVDVDVAVRASQRTGTGAFDETEHYECARVVVHAPHFALESPRKLAQTYRTTVGL